MMEILNRVLPPRPPEEAAAWFIHATTITLSLWLTIRGGVIVVFKDHYSTDVSFEFLNLFPMAPESWGWVLLVIGGLTTASVLYDVPKLLRPCALAASVICSIVGTVFATSFFGGSLGAAFTTTGWYGLGILFFIRYVASLRWEI